MKQVETNQEKKIFRDQFFEEAELWLKLNDKHLIHLYGVNYIEVRPFFISERATGGTLIHFLREIGAFRLRECLTEAALGLGYLHRHGIAHGDLKGNNILVCGDKDTDSVATKVADFGLSVFVDRAGLSFRPDQLGAIRWKAPECLQGGLPTRESDIFSFGMCIIEAATQRFPWGGYSRSNVERMRDFDPEKRIDVSTVVSTLKDGALNKVGDEAVPSEHDQSDPDVKRDEGNSNVDRTLWPSRINRWHRNNRLPHVLKMPDRLGDYMASLRNDFVVNNPVCDRGLDLSGQLSGYERETRVLLKLASTGRVVETLLRFGHVIESYVKVLGLEMTDEVRQWSEQLMRERRERLDLFSRILSDKQLFLEAMGNETQEMELMTLLKHGLTRYEEILMPEEMDIISEVYDRVVSYSEVVLVGEPPNWFLSSNDLVCDLEEFFYLDDVRVSKSVTGGILGTCGGDHQSCEDQEEACLRQVEVWAAELHDASAEAQTPRAHMTLADVGKVLPTPLALLPIFETFMTGRSTGTRFAENSFGPIELALRIRRN
ncbi:hypothetical protein PC129_g3423 [Phytophthora cactorum]|uniref:Protein kinase domain-containing protein n=4 Tax=Phytophthora cactorum TaxID=29920 RepID=A0A8T1IPE9_9STRA|nr:hypothetical protein PC114_g5648 [Phytophthora cactorum]KAG3225983.1 hypothetical protein PC129_g3423 [Phytophthora cactorum]